MTKLRKKRHTNRHAGLTTMDHGLRTKDHGPSTQAPLAEVHEILAAYGYDAGKHEEAKKSCQEDKGYEELKQALTDHYQPKSPVEQVLVERIAVLDWRLKRSIMAEKKSIQAIPGQESCLPPAGALERILKYERTMDQELHRAITALEHLRASALNAFPRPLTPDPRPPKKDTNEAENSPFSRSNEPTSPADPDFKSESRDSIMKSPVSKNESPDSIIDTPVEAMIEALFPSAARLKLLSILLLESPGRFYVRELAAKTGLWFRPVHRELTNLAGVGIVLKEVNGQQAYYRINEQCPLVPELRSMFAKGSRFQ